MMYRQDLPGFGEFAEGKWDSWARVNTTSKEGGIPGVFRQGGEENSQVVHLHTQDADGTYQVKKAPTDELVDTLTGGQLPKKGFETQLNQSYSAVIFSVEKIPE